MRSVATDEVEWSVGQSVCLSVTTVCPVKMAEPIEMPFSPVAQNPQFSPLAWYPPITNYFTQTTPYGSPGTLLEPKIMVTFLVTPNGSAKYTWVGKILQPSTNNLLYLENGTR